MKFLKFLRKKYKYILAVIFLLPFLYLEVLAYSAAWVFNRAMAEQEMFSGTVTVEKLYGKINGKTDFEGLKWQNELGETVLYIPEGTIGVKPLDIIQGKFETESLYRIRLKKAKIRLGLDEDMRPDFLPEFKPKKAPMPKEKKFDILAADTEEDRLRISEEFRKQRAETLKYRIKNFNYNGREFDMELLLEECAVEIFHRGKHYLLNSVNVDSHIKSGELATFTVRVGQFSGAMTGGSINIHGNIDFAGEEPTIESSVLFQKINPESLGIIDNLDDYMTLEVYFAGDIAEPVGDGVITMQKLDVPNLPFKDLRGEFKYQNGIFKFNSLTAKIWDGELNLTGDYNMDTRYYHINGTAKHLLADKALPNDSLRTTVDANLHLVANENSRNMAIWGDFVSTNGSYEGIPFDKISGSFTNAYHDLRFYDAKIDIGYYELSSNFIGVKDGKLTLDPVFLTNVRTNKVRARYDHDREEKIKTFL